MSCMCDFLRTVEEGKYDMLSRRGSEIPCVNGIIDTGSDQYPCQNVVLLSMVGLSELLQGNANEEGSDCWGWTASTGEEIAIIGLESMVGFVDITDPVNPIYLGKLPARGNPSYWRDIKIYGNYAFIVSENTNHGMQVRWSRHSMTVQTKLQPQHFRIIHNQVIEMTQMVNLDVSQGPVTFAETVHFPSFKTAHNIFINEDTGYAYVVGSNLCAGGLYIININNPLSPTFEACFDKDGYVHDVQCKWWVPCLATAKFRQKCSSHSSHPYPGVIYKGADTRYTGREICFA